MSLAPRGHCGLRTRACVAVHLGHRVVPYSTQRNQPLPIGSASSWHQHPSREFIAHPSSSSQAPSLSSPLGHHVVHYGAPYHQPLPDRHHAHRITQPTHHSSICFALPICIQSPSIGFPHNSVQGAMLRIALVRSSFATHRERSRLQHLSREPISFAMRFAHLQAVREAEWLQHP